jgi:hypothetical protein
MGGRTIKRTMTVLHIDAAFFILITVLVVGKSFLQHTPIMQVLTSAALTMAVFGVIEFLAYGLKLERRFAWFLTALYLPVHVEFALMVAKGTLLAFLGTLPYHNMVLTVIAGYFLFSIVYGYMGLLSGQTLRTFFSRSSKIQKENA